MGVVGFILMLLGGLNMAWFLLWALLAWSGTVGAKLSKKVGTDNENTDNAIAIGQDFKKKALNKFITSAVLAGVGAILYFLVG